MALANVILTVAVLSGDSLQADGYVANSPLVSQIVFTNSGTTRMTTTKQYDFLNRLTTIQTLNPEQSTINSYNYQINAANQRTRANLADASYWVYGYDNLGQVISGKRVWQDGTPVAGQQYNTPLTILATGKAPAWAGMPIGGPCGRPLTPDERVRP